jgi:hypothetical protein
LQSTAGCVARSEVKNDVAQCSNGTTFDMCVVIEPATARLQNTLVAVTVRYRTPVPTLSVSFLDQTAFTFLGPIWVEGKSAMRIE